MTLGELKDRMTMREQRQWWEQRLLEAQQEANAQAAQAAKEQAAQQQRPFRG